MISLSHFSPLNCGIMTGMQGRSCLRQCLREGSYAQKRNKMGLKTKASSTQTFESSQRFAYLTFIHGSCLLFLSGFFYYL